MRSYIDPRVFTFTDEEWSGFNFAARLEDLAGALSRFQEEEDKAELSQAVFRFRASEAVFLMAYELNPIINTPNRPAFYQRQYQSSVLPAVMRRLDYCPVQVCQGALSGVRGLPICAAGASEILAAFVDDLNVCAGCSDVSKTCLATHQDVGEGLIANEFFDFTAELPRQIAVAGNPQAAFPWAQHAKELAQLRLALWIRLSQFQSLDATWRAFALGEVAVSATFWRELRGADFRDEEGRYKDRILDVLVQIVAARDVDIHEHRMVSQTVTVGGSEYGRWNAYVFQSGASDRDRRCSRIYYARSSSGVYLERYESDAH